MIASTGFAVFSPTKVPFSYLYLFLTDAERLEYYGHIAVGAAYPAVNPKLIGNMDIVIPGNDVLNRFHSITGTILINTIYNEQEVQSLAQIRDSLLPRLMKGELAL